MNGNSAGAEDRLTLMGGFRLERDGVEVVLPGAGRRLVALLGLRSRPSRGAVAGELWPDTPERRALGNLRTTLHRLHSTCPELIRVGAGVLRTEDSVEVDFREVTAWARAVLAGDDTAIGAPIARGALGELLPGWYDEWVLREREQLRPLRVHALESVAERLSAAGRFAEALRAAGAAVQLEPLRESAHRMVVRIHLAEGNAVEALREFEAFRRLLDAELGVPPSRLMTRLVDGLRPAE